VRQVQVSRENLNPV